METTSTTTAATNAVVNNDERIMFLNFCFMNKKASKSLVGVYVMPDFAMPSQKEQLSVLFNKMLVNNIEIDGWHVKQSEFNGKIWAEKHGLLSELL